MPFLHWETSRKRRQFAEEIRRLVNNDKKDKIRLREKAKRNDNMIGLEHQQREWNKLAGKIVLWPIMETPQHRKATHPLNCEVSYLKIGETRQI